MAWSALLRSVVASAPSVRENADPDAGRYQQVVPRTWNGRLQTRQKLLRQSSGVFTESVAPRFHNRKLVAPQPGESIFCRHFGEEPFRYFAQSRSPVEWPSVSLMYLKRSRSSQMTATCAVRLPASAMASPSPLFK